MYGGAARGGKSYALLLEPLRHAGNPGFEAVVFRRSRPEITQPEGLWPTSQKIYPHLGAIPHKTLLHWQFPSAAKVRFHHLTDHDLSEWQGAYAPLICFDELTHFSEEAFFFLLSRNGGTCGVKPYIRATCNPDPNSWVKAFLAPWVDKTFPNPAAAGEVRWFIRDNGLITWVEEGTEDAKSLTFIPASVYDNKILLDANPSVIANLKALPAAQRAAMLDGSWEVVVDGSMFKRAWFPIVNALPTITTFDEDGEPHSEEIKLKVVRAWDMASTPADNGKDTDWSVGVKLGRADDGSLYVLDVQRVRGTPQVVEALIRKTAMEDGNSVPIFMEEEGGSSGKVSIDYYTRHVLPGFTFRGIRSTKKKTKRAEPVSSFAERCGIKLLRAHWNNDFLNELSAFPNPRVHDDQVDALSLAFSQLFQKRVARYAFG